MKITKPFNQRRGNRGFPKGYSVSGSFLPALSTRFPAAGSLKSTAADMLKYVAWHLAENDEVVKLTHRPAGNTVWSHDNSFTVGLNWQILNHMGDGRFFKTATFRATIVCVHSVQI